MGSDKLRATKKSEILLDIGQLCSWQYSIKAGILKFDSSGKNLLGSMKHYYAYEELIRNKDIRRIMKSVLESESTCVDDEIFYPIINKWFIVRGRCIDMDKESEPNQFVGIILDNTERRLILKQMQTLSVTDELTGLKNRRFFFEAFRNELNLYRRSGKMFSIAMIDLDHFKMVNDTYGHPAGDFILKTFSGLLQQGVRPYDLVARIGGEEFVILFPEISKFNAEGIIFRIREKVLESISIFEDSAIDYTFSCGLGDASELELYTEDEFITIIDSRLYKAKDSGRNLVISGG